VEYKSKGLVGKRGGAPFISKQYKTHGRDKLLAGSFLKRFQLFQLKADHKEYAVKLAKHGKDSINHFAETGISTVYRHLCTEHR